MKRDPQKTGRVGIIKLTSRNITKKQPKKTSKEFKLWSLVQAAREAGDIKEALRRIDMLIIYVQEQGMPSFEYQVDRMLMIDPGNFAQLIPIYEKQLDYYAIQENVLGQVDTLVSLTAVCINSGQLQQARHYVELAEEIISTIPDEQKEREISSSLNGRSRLDSYLEQIRQAKRYIDETTK